MNPLGRRVYCKPILTEDHYPGSPILLTPDRVALETKQMAEVIAVGPGAYDADLEEFVSTDPRLVPGAWIVHTDFMRVEGPDNTFFLNESDIVAILDTEDA